MILSQENALEAILIEATMNGLDRSQRHEAGIRYRNALQEFKEIAGDSPGEYGTNESYALASQSHAALKARNYIERHKQ